MIHLTTFIKAPVERVFQLSLHIRLHKDSMKAYQEQIVNSSASGIMGLNDTVTWTAKHLFKKRMLKVKITRLEAPHLFVDEQIEGDFRSMKHEHYFKPVDNGTIMIDQFWYELPYGPAGRLADIIFMKKYMKKLLEERNKVIRETAESTLWKKYLEA